jgi:hypothetical protein
MSNRIWPPIGGPEGPGPAPDFWVVYVEHGGYYHVSEETARVLLGKLTRWWVPRWVSFTVLGGARARIRSRTVESVEESTREFRTWNRKLRDALKSESGDDPQPWEEGPW